MRVLAALFDRSKRPTLVTHRTVDGRGEATVMRWEGNGWFPASAPLDARTAWAAQAPEGTRVGYVTNDGEVEVLLLNHTGKPCCHPDCRRCGDRDCGPDACGGYCGASEVCPDVMSQ